MTITITEEDLKKAQAEINEFDSNMCECCLVFQMFNRVGIPVSFVGLTQYRLNNGQWKNMPRRLTEVVSVNPRAWPSFVGRSFEI